MKRFLVACFFCVLVASLPLQAASKNIADYPLRIHIFSRSETNFYHWRQMDVSQGDGRANLFANGGVQGVDFSFECSDKLRSSFGYETYPAKWKKPNQELIVLLPVFGKSNTYWTCNLKTDVKDFAYLKHNGRMSSESSADFKAWMQRHDYDPEHGKDMPVNVNQPASPQPAKPAETK